LALACPLFRAGPCLSCDEAQGFFKQRPTLGFVPHFAPSGAPPLGQNTDTKVSLGSQLTTPSACTDRMEAPAGPGSPFSPFAPGAPCGPSGPCGPVSPFGPGSFPQAVSVNAIPRTTAVTIFFIPDPSAPARVLETGSDILATGSFSFERCCVR
jgi:hypothetical protein